jgi:hypothetical protein
MMVKESNGSTPKEGPMHINSAKILSSHDTRELFLEDLASRIAAARNDMAIALHLEDGDMFNNSQCRIQAYAPVFFHWKARLLTDLNGIPVRSRVRGI